MLDVILGTPVYLWVLLIALVLGGIKAARSRVISLGGLWPISVAFSVWSLYAVMTTYGMSGVTFLYWVCSMALGTGVGLLSVNGTPLRCDKDQRRLQLPGSWMPLVLSMVIFFLKYALGVIYALHPEQVGVWRFFLVDLGATVLTGVFVGRSLGYFWQYRAASHTYLAGESDPVDDDDR